MFGPLIELAPSSRPDSEVTADAIAAFWEAWPRLRGLLEKELADGRYGEGTEELTKTTEEIDPGLEWDLMPGRAASHALCLSAAADPGLRPLTENWRRSAPDPDSVWEFHPARIAVSPAPQVVGTISIDPADVTVVVETDTSREELNLTVGHPDFSHMDESLQFQVAFRLLDDLLGEDGMEQWIGSVDVVPHPLPWGVPFLDLTQEVDRQAAETTGRQWQMVDADDPDLGAHRLFINRAIKRLDFLDLDSAVTVSIEVSGPDDALVREVEDDLAAALGAQGVIFAHRIFDTFTVIYAYASPDVLDAVRSLADRWQPDVYEALTEFDPGWDTYEEMR